MRPRRSYLDFLRDILNAAQQAQEFVEGLDFDTFCADTKSLFAVVRTLEIIGEAARHIPQSMKDDHPQVPWRQMLVMRNLLIHQYFGVDLEVLWRTIQEDLPPLREAIQRILAELEDETEGK